MAVNVTVTVQGEEAYQRALQALSPSRRGQWLRDAMLESGLLVQKLATTKYIERGGSHPPLKDRLTSRTGELRRSIRVDEGGLPNRVEIGSDLVYSRVHELGIFPFPPRPYLQPAAREGIDSGKFADIFKRSWSRVARGV